MMLIELMNMKRSGCSSDDDDDDNNTNRLGMAAWIICYHFLFMVISLVELKANQIKSLVPIPNKAFPCLFS